MAGWTLLYQTPRGTVAEFAIWGHVAQPGVRLVIITNSDNGQEAFWLHGDEAQDAAHALFGQVARPAPMGGAGILYPQPPTSRPKAAPAPKARSKPEGRWREE